MNEKNLLDSEELRKNLTFFENTILNFLNKVIFGIQRNSFGTWNMFEKHIPKYLIYLSATSFPDRGQFFSEKTFVYEKVIFTT